MTADAHTPRVVPPPLLFQIALCGGLAAQLSRPLPILAQVGAGRITGAVAVAAGLAICTWVTLVFRRCGTPVSPLRPSRRLVVSGPYRFSRNPDYIGQSLVYLGVALALNSSWVMGGLAPCLLLVRYAVIAREERYLHARFGERYARYCRRVRRWL